MPRDLFPDHEADMPQLGREDSTPANFFTPTILKEDRFKKMGDIHPFVQLLNYENLDDCDWLEHAAFDPNEAATREKVGTSVSRLVMQSISSSCSLISMGPSLLILIIFNIFPST